MCKYKSPEKVKNKCKTGFLATSRLASGGGGTAGCEQGHGRSVGHGHQVAPADSMRPWNVLVHHRTHQSPLEAKLCSRRNTAGMRCDTAMHACVCVCAVRESEKGGHQRIPKSSIWVHKDILMIVSQWDGDGFEGRLNAGALLQVNPGTGSDAGLWGSLQEHLNLSAGPTDFGVLCTDTWIQVWDLTTVFGIPRHAN